MSSQEPSVPRRRNPRGQGEVLKAQLVDAAAKLLATLDQPETLTLRQVAREVGVAPASIYSHFTDLSALIQHVLRLRYQELARLMDEAAQVAGPAPWPTSPRGAPPTCTGVSANPATTAPSSAAACPPTWCPARPTAPAPNRSPPS